MSVKKAFNRQSHFSAESILRQALTPLRIEMAGKLLRDPGKPFTERALDDFLDRLENAVPDPKWLKEERSNVMAALSRGTAPQPPNVSRPETQLMWAAVLFHVREQKTYYNQKWQGAGHSYFGDVHESGLWKQVEDAPRTMQELVQHAYYVTESLRRPDTRFTWGPPGSWYYFDPEKNLINVDLLVSLICGFEHTRGVLFHEIGHSQLTTKFPKKSEELRRQMEDLRKKGEGIGSLTAEEYMKLRLLAAEFGLRHRLHDATENNCVNRFAANMGRLLAQDYAYSLNNQIVTAGGYGQMMLDRLKAEQEGADAQQEQLERQKQDMRKKLEEALRDTEKYSPKQRDLIRKRIERLDDDAQKRFTNLISAVNMAFFRHNGLFEDSDAGWKETGVRPEWVRRTDAKAPAAPEDAPQGVGHPDFQHLMDLCGGPQGLESLQPQPADRWRGAAHFNALTDRHAERRGEVMEEIWEKYFEKTARKLMEQAKEQVEQELEDKRTDEKSPGKKGQKSPKGQPQGGGQQSGGFEPGQDGVNDKGKTLRVDLGKKKDGQNGKNEQRMPDVDIPSESLPDKEAKNGNDKGKTIQEMLEEMKKKLQDALKEKANGQNKPGEGEGDGDEPGEGRGDKQARGNPSRESAMDGMMWGEQDSDDDAKTPSKKAGKDGKAKTLDDLARGDWSDYPAMTAQLRGPIAMVARMLRKIQERQQEKAVRRSRTLETLPQDKEMDRLDRAAHRELILKKATGQQIGEQDLKRFQGNEEFEKPAKIDIVLMIDGSGSMDTGKGGTKATALEIALLSGTILYEAAKQIDANVYIVLWGNDDPVILARPGDDARTIGKNIVSAREGLGSGTNMANGIRKVVNLIARQKGSAASYGGLTHMMVISDGDIYDKDNTKKDLDTLFKSSKYFTMDFAIIRGLWRTEMEKLAKDMKSRQPLQKIGVVTEGDNEKIPVAIVGALLEKMRTCNSFTAVPNAQKRKTFRRAASRMEPRR